MAKRRAAAPGAYSRELTADELELVRTAARFGERCKAMAGQLVQWKEGLNNRGPPGPFIVQEILATPILRQTENADLDTFHEPLDLSVYYWMPILDEKGKAVGRRWSRMLVDSRRVELLS